MSEYYESELLQAAQEGDIEAYEELQLLLEPDVRRFVRRLVGHDETTDDILQDVFLKFYLHLTSIQPATLRAYIFRIARNRCYDDFRRVGRVDELSLDEETVQVRVSFTAAEDAPQPDDTTHWLLLHLEIRTAIDRLPPPQRDALILYSEEGLAYAEIAEVMDVSVGTVKSRIFHAKRNLRGLLRPETVLMLDDEFGQGASARSARAPATPQMLSVEEESHHA